MALGSKLKLGALGLILCVLAAAVFIALVPFLVSHDAIRLRLTRDLSAMTGYNVQLREPPQITVFPYFRAVLPHVALTDNSEANAPLMEAEEIIVHMSLWDALRGRARFSETQLIRPHFTLAKPLNAALLLKALTQAGTGGSAAEADISAFFRPFGRIIIESGRLDYPAAGQEPQQNIAPAEAKQAYIPPAPNMPPLPQPKPDTAPTAQASLPAAPYETVRSIQAEINRPANSSRASLSATALWHGADTSLEIAADNMPLLLRGGKAPLRVSFNSDKGGATFTGTVRAVYASASAAGGAASPPKQAFSMRGHISARSPGLDQTLGWLKIRPPFGANLTAPFVWESDLKADSAHAELNNIALTVGAEATGSSGRGALIVSIDNSLPHISGSMAFETLNISLPAQALFAADRQTAGGRAEAEKGLAVDMPVFNLFGLDLRISCNKAVFNGILVNNPAASIQMQKNGLIFDIGAMQIFDGTAQSTLRLQSDNDRLTAIVSRFSAADMNLSKLREALSAFGFAWPEDLKLQGKANISLNLRSTLPDSAAAEPSRKNEKPKKAGHRHNVQSAPNIQAAESADLPLAAPSYQSVFTQDIWPYAQGELNIAARDGSANFAMPAFIDAVKSGQAFSLASIAAPESADFKFDRLEGKFTLDKGQLSPLSVFINFDGHRLELEGEADAPAGKETVNGILDPVLLDAAGQCANLQCVRQSLTPLLRFKAQNALPSPAADSRNNADKAAKTDETAPKDGKNAAQSAFWPQIQILPY